MGVRTGFRLDIAPHSHKWEQATCSTDNLRAKSGTFSPNPATTD
uniref:Uncharacterized protein n=1 Tax=Anguilla anguilla TaxID=7936 RepID=A0A0E9TGS5_ANGAN